MLGGEGATTESTSGGASAAPPDTPHRPPVATRPLQLGETEVERRELVGRERRRAEPRQLVAGREPRQRGGARGRHRADSREELPHGLAPCGVEPPPRERPQRPLVEPRD